MNAYNRSLSILFAIAATILALFGYRFLPERRYLATEDPAAEIYLYGATLPNGETAARWLDQEDDSFRCVYPENMPDYSYYCSYNLGYGFDPANGKNLSRYKKIVLSMEYTGNAPKLRFFARNYSRDYTVGTDPNSSKYNAIFLSTHDVNEPVTLDISEFVVSEWWLMSYHIPREQSFPELNSVVNLGIDFSDSMTVGNHDVKINKIEFIGEWVSRETWYLSIIALWLLGVFVSTVRKLTLLRNQKFQHEQVILKLNEHNRNLVSESDRFRKLSTVDTLTETYNRFGIDQIVSALLENETASDKPVFSIILCDIDYFKRVNDRRGHDAGDRVLQKVARIISRNIRDIDHVGRWGGEEFVVILPFTSHHFALAMAEKIRISASIAIFEPDDPLVVTLSSGVSTLFGNESFADVFKRTDDALYTAKTSGRNCCVLASAHSNNA